MTALILGATGLTGEILLRLLLENKHYDKVISITRKPLAISHGKHINIIDSLEHPEKTDLGGHSVDVIFSCLGTTRKKTPDLGQYRHIEISIPLAIAGSCITRGLQQIHYISAVGVNDKSKNFYISLKSQAEKSILSLPQHIQKFIYRPALIIGKRKEKRFLEKLSMNIFKIFNPLFSLGKLKRFKAISAESIAISMIYQSMHPSDQTFKIIENEMIAANKNETGNTQK